MLFASEIRNKTLGTLLLLPNKHVKIYWYKTFCMLRVAAPSLLTLFVAFSIYIYTGLEMDYRYYDGTDYYMKQLALILLILGPGYFINTYLSLAFKKFSFFLSAGLSFAWFALHIFFFELTNATLEEGLTTLFITGSIASLICYFRSIKAISGHSISS